MGLHELGTDSWQLDHLASLSGNFARAYGSEGMPLDVPLRLCRMFDGLVEPVANQHVLSEERRSSLQAFWKATQQLSSTSLSAVQLTKGFDKLEQACAAIATRHQVRPVEARSRSMSNARMGQDGSAYNAPRTSERRARSA
mmetsp:Transcript_50567/g.93508  ORF Transcript_50567/g.93508 Transcript_50567/m.93508 type:complete len:141 (+) Transcript_50567:112-534(+)